jgi:hypothetical protein
MNLKDIAHLLGGVDLSFLSKIEKANRICPPNIFITYSCLFGKNMAEIFPMQYHEAHYLLKSTIAQLLSRLNKTKSTDESKAKCEFLKAALVRLNSENL